MNSSNEEELQRIKKKIIILNLLGTPGLILLGLGLYGLFGANGDAFHPALNNSNVIYSFIGVGAVSQIWEFTRYLSLLKKKAELINDKNT